jgi:hypothetical protein
MLKSRKAIAALAATGSFLTVASSATASTLKVTVENLAPQRGTLVAATWVGFHDGSFDSFDVGQLASSDIENLAEDANTTPLANSFLESGSGVVEGVLLDEAKRFTRFGDIGPGQTVTKTFEIDGTLSNSQYFSYGAMVVPSNDAFIGNDDPLATRVFDNNGNFLSADLIVSGDRVWDAGTERNDEIPVNTALLGQSEPNTGVTTNEVISQHPGFLPDGNILEAFPEADFSAPNYSVARIRVEEVQAVPEPITILGSLTAMGFGVFFKKAKSKKFPNPLQIKS